MTLDFEVDGHEFTIADECLSIDGDPVEDDAVISLAIAYAKIAYPKAFEVEPKGVA